MQEYITPEKFFSPNMRRALTSQFLVSLMYEMLPQRGKIPVAALKAHIISRHKRISGKQIDDAIAAGKKQERFYLCPGNKYIGKLACCCGAAYPGYQTKHVCHGSHTCVRVDAGR